MQYLSLSLRYQLGMLTFSPSLIGSNHLVDDLRILEPLLLRLPKLFRRVAWKRLSGEAREKTKWQITKWRTLMWCSGELVKLVCVEVKLTYLVGSNRIRVIRRPEKIDVQHHVWG
jgi:hypothetical protein